MTKRKKLEQAMLNGGFASARIVAAKLGLRVPSVLRLVQTGALESTEALGMKFIPLTSVAKYAGAEGAVLLKLDDWSDVSP